MDNGWVTIIIGSITIIIGLILIGVGYYSLFRVFETSAKSDTNVSLTAIKSAYTLVVGGLIIIILGLLHLMGIIPWYKV